MVMVMLTLMVMVSPVELRPALDPKQGDQDMYTWRCAEPMSVVLLPVEHRPQPHQTMGSCKQTARRIDGLSSCHGAASQNMQVKSNDATHQDRVSLRASTTHLGEWGRWGTWPAAPSCRWPRRPALSQVPEEPAHGTSTIDCCSLRPDAHYVATCYS